MSSLPLRLRFAVAFAFVCGLFALWGFGQTPSAELTALAENNAAASVFGAQSPQIEPSLLNARVRDGVYTVDGLVAKVRLNYDLQNAAFLYFFVPGIGTAVVSATPDPVTLATAATLTGEELVFTIDGHHFRLTGFQLEGQAGDQPAQLYVHFDRSAWRLARYAMVGFGDRAQAPYRWPGALASGDPDESTIPAVPASLLPAYASSQRAVRAPAPVDPALLRSVARH